MNRTPTVVFDTNVIVSAALRPRAVPAAALNAALDSGRVVTCDQALHELAEVLERDKFDQLVPRTERLAVLALVKARTTLITLLPRDLSAVQGACRDPDDELFLALALAAGAETIVTGDDDLLTLTPWRGVAICTPAQYLAESA